MVQVGVSEHAPRKAGNTARHPVVSLHCSNDKRGTLKLDLHFVRAGAARRRAGRDPLEGVRRRRDQPSRLLKRRARTRACDDRELIRLLTLTDDRSCNAVDYGYVGPTAYVYPVSVNPLKSPRVLAGLGVSRGWGHLPLRTGFWPKQLVITVRTALYVGVLVGSYGPCVRTVITGQLFGLVRSAAFSQH